MNQDIKYQLRISDEVKQMLVDLAADAGVSAAEWLRQVIIEAWTSKQITNATPAEQEG